MNIGTEFWLVFDAPYVQLRVWPLKVENVEGGNEKTAFLDLSSWQLQAIGRLLQVCSWTSVVCVPLVVTGIRLNCFCP